MLKYGLWLPSDAHIYIGRKDKNYMFTYDAK